jgi:hypothetical protein
MSKNLDVLLALKALVQAALPGAKVAGFDKDDSKPERVGGGGCIIGHAGDPGEPVVDLSPLTYNYSHKVIVEVAGPNGEGGEPLDLMLLALGDAVDVDPYLGGLCQFLAVEQADLNDKSGAMIATMNWATIAFVAEYATEDPLG